MINPSAYIDHTLLTARATSTQIETLCEEAVEHGFASVCIPPVYVPLAVDRLYGSNVGVGTVVGFPCGYNSSRQKVQETADLVAAGATEIDMVVQIGALLDGELDSVGEEIAQVVMVARESPVKVILECCYLTQELIEAATLKAIDSGARYVKTSTGFGPGGATLEDVRTMARTAAGRIAVKAAGGIRTLDLCLDFIHAGADRIGTSSGLLIMDQWRAANV